MNAVRERSRRPEANLSPPGKRIHCNRNLRMERIRAIGFDLDHTLAHYHGPRVEELAYHLTRQRLVRMGYPRALLSIPYVRNSVIRGLMVDKRRGHILKMDYHNYVTRAYHGRREMASKERKAAYKTGRIRMSSDNYASVDTLFHVPEVVLFSVLVEMHEAGKVSKPPRKIYKDVRTAIDEVHGDGSLKAQITARLGTFLRKDSELALVLEQFRLADKKLFLLTNSEWYYSDLLLGYLLNEGDHSWTEFFDLICVEAGKPAFFTGKKPFAPQHDTDRNRVPILSGGNAVALERILGYSGDEVLYFGDHTYGDILRSKRSVGWRTAMVVEELEDEVRASRKMSNAIEQHNTWSSIRDALEAESSQLERLHLHLEKQLRTGAGEEGTVRAKLQAILSDLDAVQGELKQARERAAILGAKVSKAYNRYWGPLFKEGSETSRFGHQVKVFACIYMSRVSNFTAYGHDHYFRSAKERMPHELD